MLRDNRNCKVEVYLHIVVGEQKSEHGNGGTPTSKQRLARGIFSIVAKQVKEHLLCWDL